mmetsp:Transcript_1696/g.4403  ORF Transcript_1696/g.4403 Transcript_1696/m.4403 type:complete len:207 (-) Transcript_1696:917-1537(-)
MWICPACLSRCASWASRCSRRSCFDDKVSAALSIWASVLARFSEIALSALRFFSFICESSDASFSAVCLMWSLNTATACESNWPLSGTLAIPVFCASPQIRVFRSAMLLSCISASALSMEWRSTSWRCCFFERSMSARHWSSGPCICSLSLPTSSSDACICTIRRSISSTVACGSLPSSSNSLAFCCRFISSFELAAPISSPRSAM